MSRAPRWSVGIIVPARDEAPSIGPCLASILATHQPEGIERWVVVVADRCGDDATAKAARAALGDHGAVIVTEGGNVGAARRIGAASALARFDAAERPRRRTWLLTTDADSTVPRGWLDAHLTLADAGAASVAGTVTVASFEEHSPHVPAAYAAAYVSHADGTHPHVHGANLGVRGDAYLEAGGWHALATGEDHDLWGRLQAIGAPSISTIEAPVITSGRRTGRAPNGFAGLLGELGDLAGGQIS